MVPDDSQVQFSPVISGVTADAERTLSELFTRYAGTALPKRTTRRATMATCGETSPRGS
jgi:hypothetical protein